MEQTTQIKGDVIYMKLRCIKNFNGQLTEGRIYVTECESIQFFEITNDLGNIAPYYKHRFEKVEEDMTKADLKDGMVVETRNNVRYLVVGRYLISENGFMDIEVYENNLMRYAYGKSEYDILRVRDLHDLWGYGLIKGMHEGKIIFTRDDKSPQELELEELEKQQREIADRMKQVRESMVK